MLHACVERFDVIGGRGNILGWNGEVNKALEGFPSLDEIEDDICCDEMEDAMCEPDYSNEDTEEDEGSEQHHGFDENTGEDVACEQPQWMEVDDGSTAFKEIDFFYCHRGEYSPPEFYLALAARGNVYKMFTF
jgi:hypothetical protein